ncbi:MAG: hypothetical protein AAFV07_02945 [Bacteroidota bacterium]
MRYLIILFVSVILLPAPLAGQTIVDLFIQGPSEYDRHLGPEGQKLIADKAQSSDFVQIDILSADPGEGVRSGEWRLSADLANGYLKLEFGQWYEMEMVYWRKSDGTRLVGQAYLWKDAPFWETELFFYQYHKGEWTRLKTDSIVPYLRAEAMIDTAATIAANKEIGLDIPLPSKGDISYETQVKLPRRGKSLMVNYSWVDEREAYRNYYLVLPTSNEDGWIEMPWKDGWFGRLD